MGAWHRRCPAVFDGGDERGSPPGAGELLGAQFQPGRVGGTPVPGSPRCLQASDPSLSRLSAAAAGAGAFAQALPDNS